MPEIAMNIPLIKELDKVPLFKLSRRNASFYRTIFESLVVDHLIRPSLKNSALKVLKGSIINGAGFSPEVDIIISTSTVFPENVAEPFHKIGIVEYQAVKAVIKVEHWFHWNHIYEVREYFDDLAPYLPAKAKKLLIIGGLFPQVDPKEFDYCDEVFITWHKLNRKYKENFGGRYKKLIKTLNAL
ncbi:MAG: hypothetical protein KKH28_00040 [Elusimicrobia bacterium]|nr:hypothetical protein [Elusimicrobiota bacterium]